MMLRICLLALLSIWATCNAEVELITEPRSGEEYVFVSGGQPQALKQTKNTKDTYFETSHKIPEKLPTHYVSRDTENYSNTYSKTKPKLEETEYSPIIDVLNAGHVESSFNVKRESSEGIIEIEEDKKAIKKDYKKKASGTPIKPTEIEVDLPLSKIENIKISEKNSNHDVNSQMHVELEPMSQSGKLVDNLAITTQKPILTTVAPTTSRSFDVLSINHGSADSINAGLYSDSNLSLEEAGTEQKQTRIEIKKGPNGQDYEYEYVYYYYDDADEVNETSSKKEPEPTPPVHNSHDGPQNEATNQIKSSNSRNKNKYSTIERSSSTTTTTTQAPESNEVLPGSRTRYRGRNIPSASSDNEPTDERLPANTRFPPRSRTTTPSVHDKVENDILDKPSRQKSRTQSVKSSEENVTQTKNRSRSNVRRPSLELVDSASFNTHASDVPVSQYKEIRSRLNSVEDKETEKSQKQVESSRGSSRNREESRQEIRPVEENVDEELSNNPSTVASVESDSSESVTLEQDTTEITTMAAMDKVALELYAYIAGENSKNEINSSEIEDDTTVENSDDITTTEFAITTEEVTTTTTTTTPAPTTTTTTTTTTPAPVPSSTVRGSRFRARGGVKPKVTASTTSTEAAPSAPKTRGRFGGNPRPQFGRGRSNTASVPEQQEEGSITKSEVVPVQNSVTPSRSRFGNRSRPARTSTTAAPTEESPSTEASSGSRLRNRPSLKLRGAKRPGVSTTTASSAPSDLEASDIGSDAAPAEPSSTTAKSLLGRGRLVGNLRPLRPNPRIAIGGRTNVNSNANSNASTIATSTEGSSTAASTESKENSGEQVDATTQQPGEVTVGNPLSRLRGRPRLHVAAAPKPKSAQPTAPRRPSPLLARRRQPEPEVSESTPTSNESPAANEQSADSAQESNSSSDEAQNSSDVETPSEEPSTEAPKGISSLIARRRLVNRKPGTLL